MFVDVSERQGFVSPLPPETPPPVKAKPPWRFIMSIVLREFKVREDFLLSPARDGEVTIPRQVLYWLLRTVREDSLSSIGLKLNRDHTSVLSGINKINRLLDVDPKWRERIDAIVAEINSKYCETA